MKIEKPKMGTILVHSIGWGCDIYYQVVKVTPKTVVAHRLKDKVVKRNVKAQSCEIEPMPNEFDTEGQYGIFRLVVKDDGTIGPNKRLDGWHIWKGNPLNQWSP